MRRILRRVRREPVVALDERVVRDDGCHRRARLEHLEQRTCRESFLVTDAPAAVAGARDCVEYHYVVVVVVIATATGGGGGSDGDAIVVDDDESAHEGECEGRGACAGCAGAGAWGAAAACQRCGPSEEGGLGAGGKAVGVKLSWLLYAGGKLVISGGGAVTT